MRQFAAWSRLLTGAMMLTLVAGCASTLSARVTTFQQWPADAQGASYRIVPPAGDTLEAQAFSDMIRAAIGRTGLYEAQGGATPRFNVHFEYGSTVSNEWVQRYHDPYYYNGFNPWGWGGYYGGYSGWGGGIFYSPPTVVNVPVQVEKNTLTVSISDNQRQGAQVYKSTAVSSSGSLTEVMPYLARAVFDGFPGNNGQVRDITYERQR
ncbi:MAG TPA: DUF4136 domain-containing protein [Pusillimonas sp.]|uniref:DUF4136 domain-containing protein n=1 Tax=Pusillimonas sp. TaxID=3040095 RepID=UPI002CFED197|nr:DUF4136 domain-containing protein [Pusillimonas sp.]HUH86708.1 DUF4136 domain-containing protein [Pusillimonas sp.]